MGGCCGNGCNRWGSKSPAEREVSNSGLRIGPEIANKSLPTVQWLATYMYSRTTGHVIHVHVVSLGRGPPLTHPYHNPHNTTQPGTWQGTLSRMGQSHKSAHIQYPKTPSSPHPPPLLRTLPAGSAGAPPPPPRPPPLLSTCSPMRYSKLHLLAPSFLAERVHVRVCLAPHMAWFQSNHHHRDMCNFIACARSTARIGAADQHFMCLHRSTCKVQTEVFRAQVTRAGSTVRRRNNSHENNRGGIRKCAGTVWEASISAVVVVRSFGCFADDAAKS